MKNTLIKSFDPILDDYAFFMACSNEAEMDLKAYRKHLPAPFDIGNPFNMLDFGTGTGIFSADFLHQLGSPPEHLFLTLVEPGETARLEAIDRLRPFTGHLISHYPSLPEVADEHFDLILSNHALYYVTDLAETVRLFTKTRRPSGKCLFAMAGMENTLIQCWATGFQSIGAQIPFFTGEDLLQILEQQEVPFQREKVDFSIEFTDSTENRMKILRFLFGQHLLNLPEVSLLQFFEPYRNKGDIRIDTSHYIYVIG